MKILCTDYTYDTPNLTFNVGFTVTKEMILLVTDVDNGEILYSFADPSRGGTLSGNTLALAYTGSAGMGANLQIYLDDSVAPATQPTLAELAAKMGEVVSALNLTTEAMIRALEQLASPPWLATRGADITLGPAVNVFPAGLASTSINSCAQVTNIVSFGIGGVVNYAHTMINDTSQMAYSASVLPQIQ